MNSMKLPCCLSILLLALAAQAAPVITINHVLLDGWEANTIDNEYLAEDEQKWWLGAVEPADGQLVYSRYSEKYLNPAFLPAVKKEVHHDTIIWTGTAYYGVARTWRYYTAGGYDYAQSVIPDDEHGCQLMLAHDFSVGYTSWWEGNTQYTKQRSIKVRYWMAHPGATGRAKVQVILKWPTPFTVDNFSLTFNNPLDRYHVLGTAPFRRGVFPIGEQD